MKKILTFFLAVIIPAAIFAQTNVYTVTTSGTVFVVTPVPAIADFSQPITINFATPCAGYNVVANAASTTHISAPVVSAAGTATFTITDQTQTSVSVDLSCSAAAGITAYTFVINKYVSPVTVPAGDNASAYFSRTFPTLFNNAYHYDRDGDAAYFFFDEKGMLLGPAPVNVDADDFIYVFVAARANEVDLYTAQIDGSYAPVDLLIRPNTAILSGGAQGTGTATPQPFVHIAQKLGPFTPDKATITISKNGNVLRLLEVKINPLYNGAIGVSFVSTTLEKPDFDVTTLPGGDNTITTADGGSRVLVTFNYIWYWTPTLLRIAGKKKAGSHITRGRDVLKEPTFLERINPLFGVSIDSDWSKNFFIGGNFEFARGGSVSAGWHYGQIQTLKDPNFTLGSTTFTGAKADIKLSNKMEWGTFVGVTLDTRIFNRLVSRN